MAKSPQDDAIDQEVDRVGGAYPPKQKDEFRSILVDILQKGMTIMEAIKFPAPLAELIYSQASELYAAGKYQDAGKLFYFLLRLNSKDFRFPFSYAASMHKLKNFEEATGYYVLVTTMEPNNPLPWFHAADCYIQLHNLDVAAVFLTKAIEVAGTQPQYEKLRQQASALHGVIRQALDKEE